MGHPDLLRLEALGLGGCRIMKQFGGGSLGGLGLRGFGAELRQSAALDVSVAVLLDLGDALLFLVGAHGDELDHLLGDAEAALNLVDERRGRLDDEEDVEAVVELADGVGEPATAHLLGLLHGAATLGDVAGECLNDLVDLGLFDVGPDDEHDFVAAVAHEYFFLRVLPALRSGELRRQFGCCGRASGYSGFLRLNSFMAAEGPAVSHFSTARTAMSRPSSIDSRSALLRIG